jgi:hypothetical protein
MASTSGKSDYEMFLSKLCNVLAFLIPFEHVK